VNRNAYAAPQACRRDGRAVLRLGFCGRVAVEGLGCFDMAIQKFIMVAIRPLAKGHQASLALRLRPYLESAWPQFKRRYRGLLPSALERKLLANGEAFAVALRTHLRVASRSVVVVKPVSSGRGGTGLLAPAARGVTIASGLLNCNRRATGKCRLRFSIRR
jgi:hypothetical protein